MLDDELFAVCPFIFFHCLIFIVNMYFETSQKLLHMYNLCNAKALGSGVGTALGSSSSVPRHLGRPLNHLSLSFPTLKSEEFLKFNNNYKIWIDGFFKTTISHCIIYPWNKH